MQQPIRVIYISIVYQHYSNICSWIGSRPFSANCPPLTSAYPCNKTLLHPWPWIPFCKNAFLFWQQQISARSEAFMDCAAATAAAAWAAWGGWTGRAQVLTEGVRRPNGTWKTEISFGSEICNKLKSVISRLGSLQCWKQDSNPRPLGRYFLLFMIIEIWLWGTQCMLQILLL